MDLQLTDKVAVITGSGRGIGFSIAKTLYQEGCKIILNSRTQADLDMHLPHFDPARMQTSVADVQSLPACEKLLTDTLQAFGRIDILVCNVGLSRSVKPGEETNAIWQTMFENNFFSATNMIQAARPYLKATQGSIICISSICGTEVIPGAPAGYAAAKAALNMAVKTLARPLGAENIRINAIAPGNILFPGSVWEKKLKEDENRVHEMLDKDVALKRFGTPEDIANLTAFLASSQSGFITGQVIISDGGQTRS